MHVRALASQQACFFGTKRVLKRVFGLMDRIFIEITRIASVMRASHQMDYYRHYQMPGLHAAGRKCKKNMHAFLRAASAYFHQCSVCSQRVYGASVYDVTLARNAIAYGSPILEFLDFIFRSTYLFHPRDRKTALNERY